MGHALAEPVAEVQPVRTPSSRARDENPLPIYAPWHPALRLQRAVGNAAVAGMVQARRRVSEPNDPFEREADDVARQVTATPVSRCACGGVIGLTGECDRCRARRVAGKASGVQRRAAESVSPSMRPATRAVERTLAAGGGEPLDGATRGEMESALGHDFSAVRVHRDADAARSAASIDALAYASGSDIVFGAGQYAPGSESGRQLIAHELTHVVQQGGSPGARASGAVHRQSNSGSGSGSSVADAATDAEMAELEQLMLQLFSMLDEGTRRTAIRYKTIAIGLLVDEDGNRLRIIATNNNWMNPSLRKAAAALGLEQYPVDAPVKTRGSAGAPNDAEQRLLDSADALDAEVRGMAVSRAVCVDCELAVRFYEHGEIRVVEVSVPSPSPGGAAGGSTGTAGGASEAPGTTEALQVSTRFRVIESETIPGGRTVSEVETVLAEGLEELNASVRSRGGAPIPERMTLRITTDAQGMLVGAESVTGESSALATALARQAVHSAPGSGATVAATAGMEGGAGEAVAGAAAGGASKLMRGLAWGGLALFVGTTAYKVWTAKPGEGTHEASKAAGGFIGGWLAGYAVCNLVLGLETVGWSLLICGLVAGVPGGMAGEAVADVLYEEATIDDDEIRSWVARHDLAALGRLPATEKLRLIFSLMKGWVSDDDVTAIARILRSVTTQSELDSIGAFLTPLLPELTSIGQRTDIRMALARRP